jgi:hypothetical protein
MYVLCYAPMLRCWHLIWILVMTDHPCLGVECHTKHDDFNNSGMTILSWPRLHTYTA